MPKRVLKTHLANAAKIRKKSKLDDSPGQRDDEHGNKMHYQKLNANNEVERLLLHNSKVLLYVVDHSDFPAFNVGMSPLECNETLTNYPSCAFSTPLPIYVSNKDPEKIDICYKRPMLADYFHVRMKHTRTSYLTALKSNKALQASAKNNYYHASVFDIAERLYLQPDPYFDNSYDYYFTGGNLCVLPVGEDVIHAGGDQMQEMRASVFAEIQDNSDSHILLHNKSSNKTSEKCEIFEIQPLLTSIDSSRQTCFIARQRNLVSFNFLNDNKQIKTITQFRTQSTPFISFAQSERNINTFLITTMKQHIRLYDLNSSTPALVKLFEISPKTPNISWNTVKPWRENTFLYANAKQFFLIDTRTSPEQWLNEVTSATDSLMCDHISALMPSDFNNLFYVATSHKLQCMDTRYLKKFSFSDNDGAVCRWTHQMRYAPLMMDKFRHNKTEHIALSSPIAGDLHICQLSRERNEQEICLDSSIRAPKHIYNSPCLPYQPPTLLEAYENARLSGKCLRPEANMEGRLKCCTTGLTFLKSSLNHSKSGTGILMSLNSNGDIFAHTLSKREKMETEERCNRHSDEVMNKFEQKILEQTQPSLKYTEIKNICLRKPFRCTTLSKVQKYDIDAMDNEYTENEKQDDKGANLPARPKRRLHLGRWQKSFSTLQSYQDAIVPNILSIWDIDVEDENYIKLGKLRHSEKPDPVVKVESWLKTNVNTNPPPMLTIPAEQISTYTENNTSTIFDNTFNLTQTQNSTIDFENVIHSTQLGNTSNLDTSALEIEINNGETAIVVDKLKNKKKNKKYVKGF